MIELSVRSIARSTKLLSMIPYFLLVVITVLAPGIATYLYVSIYLGSDVANFVPSYWNDQTGYWHQILTFSHVGLSGGYYGQNEMAPAISFFRFEDHGPIFVPLYGTIARLSGWDWHSGIIVNMVIVGIAIAFFIVIASLDRLQVGVTGLLALSFWPLLLYLPTASTEPFHQATAFIVAALFSNLIATRSGLVIHLKVTIVLLLLAASLIRISWALLFVPFFLISILNYFNGSRDAQTEATGPDLASSPGFDKKLIFALIFSVLASVPFIMVAFFVMRYANATGLNSIVATVQDLESSPFQGVRNLAYRTYYNLRGWLTLSPINIYTGQKLLVSGLIIFAVSRAFFCFSRLRVVKNRMDDSAFPEMLFHSLNLLSILVGTLTVYLLEGAYRVIGAHLLVSLLLMIRFRRFLPVAIVILVNVLLAPSFLTEYEKWKGNFSFDRAELLMLRSSLRNHIVYVENAKNPWCNTILIPLDFYDFRVALIPAGIGVSFIYNDGRPGSPNTLQLPPKSRYLLFDEKTYEALAETGKLNVQLLSAMPIGKLYRNLDAACEKVA